MSAHILPVGITRAEHHQLIYWGTTLKRIFCDEMSWFIPTPQAQITDTIQKRPIMIQYRGKCSEEYDRALHKINAPRNVVITLRKLKTVIPSLKSTLHCWKTHDEWSRVQHNLSRRRSLLCWPRCPKYISYYYTNRWLSFLHNRQVMALGSP